MVDSLKNGATSRYPDFFLIGAMKSGTTTLQHYLARHPDIFMSTPKEPQFFSKDEVFEKRATWYLSLFSEARPDQLCGEASTCYSRWPEYGHVPERIHRVAPAAKFIYLLRHPVERAYSHYGHLLYADGRAYSSFEQALEEEPEIVDASCYMKQLERYLEYFSRERFLILSFDELMEMPQEALKKVQRFLAVAEVDLVSTTGEVMANTAGTPHLKRTVGRYLRKIRHAPGVATLVDCLPAGRRREFYDVLQRRITQSFLGKRTLRRYKAQLSPLTPTTRRDLLLRFREETEKLEDFLGLDLEVWKR